MSRVTDEQDRQYNRQLKKTMNSSRIFFDPRDEEESLEIFAEDGYFVDKTSYWDLVTFRTGKPLLVRYRIDFRWFKNKDDYIRYLSERTLMGWSHISGSRNSGRQYWMADRDVEGNIGAKDEERLFPRKEILLGRKKRLLSQVLVLLLILLLWTTILFCIFGVTWRAFWFWNQGSVLVELPIVLIKLGMFLAFLGFFLYYLVGFFKVRSLIAGSGKETDEATGSSRERTL